MGYTHSKYSQGMVPLLDGRRWLSHAIVNIIFLSHHSEPRVCDTYACYLLRPAPHRPPTRSIAFTYSSRRWLSHANAPVYGMFVYCAPHPARTLTLPLILTPLTP